MPSVSSSVIACVRLNGATPKNGFSWRAVIAVAGHAHVVAVHVGAQRMRTDAGGDGAARHLEAEMRAMADIDCHAAFQCRPDHGMHLAGRGRHEAAGMARERMRQHIARLHQRHQRAHHLIGVDRRAVLHRPELAEMDVQRHAKLAGDALAEFDDLQAPARRAADLRMCLHAAHDVGIGARRRGSLPSHRPDPGRTATGYRWPSSPPTR